MAINMQDASATSAEAQNQPPTARLGDSMMITQAPDSACPSSANCDDDAANAANNQPDEIAYEQQPNIFLFSSWVIDSFDGQSIR